MPPKLPLPRGWKRRVRSSVLHILALSHYTFAVLLARAANSKNRQVRLRAQIDRRDNEIVLLQEELRIKNARMEQVPPHRRPHYLPLERMAILELRASRGWSARQFRLNPSQFLIFPDLLSRRKRLGVIQATGCNINLIPSSLVLIGERGTALAAKRPCGPG